MRGINLGPLNGNWKGDNVSKEAIHDYIKYWIEIPKLCQCCNKAKPKDLANISQQYKRELSDWEWLCRKCHMKKDGRLDKFARLNDARKLNKDKICEFCQRLFKYKQNHKNQRFCSDKCSKLSRKKRI